MYWTKGVLGALPEPFIVLDASFCILACNPAFEELVGRVFVNAVGQRADIALPSFAQPLVADALRHALGGKATTTPEFPIERDDETIWAQGRVAPWRTDDDAIGGVVVSMQDITRRRRERMFSRALMDVGRSLSSSLDLNQVLDTIAARTLEVMAADAAMVIGWDGEATNYTVLRASGRLSREYIAAGGMPAGKGPIYWAVKEARPVTTANILTDPAFWLEDDRRREVDAEGFRAVAAAPLAAKGRVYGALVVHYWRERTFADDEIATLTRLGEQAAVAIDNARLYGEATGRADRLRELAEVEELAAGSFDPDDLLRRIAEAATRLLDAPVAQVWIADRDTGALTRWAIHVTAAIAETTVPLTIPSDDALVMQLARDRAIIHVADVERDPLGASMTWAAAFGLPAVLAVPVADAEHFLGVVTVHGRAGWRPGDEDRALVVSLAARVGGAVEGARAYRDVVRRAERLRHLVAVTQSISASLDTSAVIQGIVDAAAAVIVGAGALVHEYDRERGMLRTLATAGENAQGLPEEFPADRGLPGLVVRDGRPVLVADPLAHPQTALREWWAARPRAAYFAVPVRAGDNFLGVLGFVVPDRSPSLEEQELLQLLAAHAGIALQNAALYESERRQGDRVRALAEVNRNISGALDLDDLLRTIASSAAQLTGVAFASFWLADDRTRTLTLTRGSEEAKIADFPRRLLAYGVGATGSVAETRVPLVIDDVRTDPRMLHGEWWTEHGLAAFAAYPVIAGDELLAILVLAHTQPLRLGPGGEGMIDLFTAQAAVAIQNARLYREANRRRDMAEALAHLGRELSGTLDVDRIEEIVTRGMADLLRVRGAAVYRYAPAGATLHAATSYGLDAAVVRGLVLRIGEGAVGLAVHTRALVTTPDVLNDPRIGVSPDVRARVEPAMFRATMAAPLLSRDRILGALVVGAERGRVFSSDEQQVFQAFTDQTALALENARLYAESDRERRDAAALAAAARELAASLDVDAVAEQLVEVVRRFFAAHASALYRVDEDGTIVSVAFGGAARAHMATGVVMDRSIGIIGRAVEQRRAVWTRDALTDASVYLSEEFRAAVTASGNRAILAVPLVVKNEVIGVLAMAHAQARIFEDREIAMLQAFADQAALALENARLYASARDSLGRLRDTQAQLVQAAKLTALGQLVSGVAHELNNPLSVVIGYGQLLLGRDLPPATRRPVELMVSQGDRMAKIVRGLLFFARQRPPERVPVKINQVIEETLGLRQNQLALSSIVVERRLGDELPMIAADAHQLQQVFLNLVLNAEQAILETGKAGRIVVRTTVTEDGRTVRAEIIDDGPGISAEALPHVFEPFFTTKEVGVGTGLGLSVSYGIVQEHGGRLSVDSRPGETVFVVELPVGAVREAPRAPAVVVPARAPSTGGRIALVVEDEPAVSDFVVSLLQDIGWRVDVASGGRAALERLRARRYDLIVSDVRMPDVNGEEFYRTATAADPLLGQRFIFITGDTANPESWEFLQQTRVPVLEKPFTPALLLDAVRRLSASPLTPSSSSA
ncbi:MAG: GAF domain-containing protein [Candidatus Rokubacteria bacterium]|nr:GAF domain-containing protein [Candidatus Rokubacteria bacterium]